MTEEMAAQLARQSRIDLTDEELPRLAHELKLMAEFATTLEAASVDGGLDGGLDGVPEWTPPTAPVRDLRPDEVAPSLPREAALALAPATADGFFRVPRTVDEG